MVICRGTRFGSSIVRLGLGYGQFCDRGFLDAKRFSSVQFHYYMQSFGGESFILVFNIAFQINLFNLAHFGTNYASLNYGILLRIIIPQLKS
jgi:hypothetical protein